MGTTEKVLDKNRPFRVRHSNGDIVAGFDDRVSATDDANARNERAKALGLQCSYTASAKP